MNEKWFFGKFRDTGGGFFGARLGKKKGTTRQCRIGRCASTPVRRPLPAVAIGEGWENGNSLLTAIAPDNLAISFCRRLGLTAFKAPRAAFDTALNILISQEDPSQNDRTQESSLSWWREPERALSGAVCLACARRLRGRENARAPRPRFWREF